MRFIIREQDYERLVAAGRLAYRSGVTESYQLTEAVEGFLVLRVDLDWRGSGTDQSLLIHMLLDANRQLTRAKLRALSQDYSTKLDVLATDGLFSVNHEGKHGAEYEELERPPGFGLLTPGFVGLGLVLDRSQVSAAVTMVTLDGNEDLVTSSATIEIDELNEELLAVMGQELAVRRYLIRLGHVTYTIWLDNYGLPVRVGDEHGTMAAENRYMRHR